MQVAMLKQSLDHWKKSALSGRLAGLRTKLLRRFARERNVCISDKLLYQVILEAEALAWTSASPLLVFPLLAEEKVQAVFGWARQQSNVQAGHGVKPSRFFQLVGTLCGGAAGFTI